MGIKERIQYITKTLSHTIECISNRYQEHNQIVIIKR